MTIIESFKRLFVSEAAPKPISKLITPYQHSDEQPEVSFRQKIYYHSISPQLQVGVTGYARLLDLANIQVNSDSDESKKIIEDWIDNTDFRTKLEAMGNTFLICGNAILEKLSDTNIQDVAEVDMASIIGKKRDEYGNTLYYTQQTVAGQQILGETKLNKFIEFNLSTISRSVWSPCIFESACLPRKVGDRMTYPLVELVVGLEDAMATIMLNNAYPEVYYTFEGANQEQLDLEVEKIRKKKPGQRMVVTKQPKIDMFESKGQSAYVDYVDKLYNSLSLACKFPMDILTGDFTSRASSETSEDMPEMIASSVKRYIGAKLKTELFDPILAQNGKNPLKENLQVTFGIQKTIEIKPENIIQLVEKKVITINEAREWVKENTGFDLFEDAKINQMEDLQNQISDLSKNMSQKPEIKTPDKPVKESKCQLCKESQHALCTKKRCRCKHVL